jgi:hypothetical protein
LALKRPVEPGAHVSHRDVGYQFDELGFCEVPAQLREQFVADTRGRGSHADRQIKHELLELTEPFALAVAREIRQRFVRDPGRPAQGGVGIESGRAADEHRGLDDTQPAQPPVDEVRSIERQLEDPSS